VADPKILNRGAEANLISAPSSFIAKKHNEIYVFTRKKRLFGKKYVPIGGGGQPPPLPPLNPPLFMVV